jgi:PAS domain S-box-containing protein
MKPDLSKHPTVLAVNDEPSVLELLVVLLEREGYIVIPAETGLRALELIESIEPDIVISDVVMPEIDGLELCRRLKQNPRTASVPVLLVSAVRKSEADSLLGLVAGADDYLEIPFHRQELLVKVARLTERHNVERHYRELVEQAVDIIYTRDLDGHITSINEAGARFFGRPVAQLVGSHLGEMLGTELAARDIEQILESSVEEPVISTHFVKNARGVVRCLEGMITLVRDAQGQPTAVRGVVRDITERRNAEEALRESEARYRAMFEKNQAIKLVIDVETATIIDANPAACEFYGYTIEEFKTKRIDEINTLSPEMVAAEMSKATSEQRNAFTFRHRLASGELRDVEVHSSPVEVRGRKLLYSIINDITERTRAEEALREREMRYGELFENANDMIYTHDLAGNLTSLNKSGERITGYTRDEAVTMNIAQVVAPEYLQTAREMIARKASEEVSTVYELEIIAKAGHRVDLEVSTRLIYKDGRPTGVQGIARDVTERKHVKAELQASEAELRALFAAMPDVIIVLDVEGRYQKIAPTNPKLLYGPPTFLIGKTLHEVFPSAQADDFLQHIKLALEARQPVSFEYSLMLDEREVWFEGTVSPMLEDTVLWVARDITERRQAESALRQAEEKFRSIFENAVEGIYQSSTDGHFIAVNPALARMLGYASPEDLIASRTDIKHQHYVDPSSRERLKSLLSERDELQNFECQVFRRDGSKIWTLENVRAVREASGALVCYEGTIEDITERKQAEEALAQQVEREALINRISRAVRRSLDIAEVFSTAVQELGTHLGVDRCTLFLKDETTRTVNNVAEFQRKGVPPAVRNLALPQLADLDAGVFQHGVLAFDDAANDSRLTDVYNRVLRAVGTRSIMYVAIKVGEEMPAVFTLSTTRSLRHWTESDIALAKAVADQTGIAIRQAELYQKASATSARETLINHLSLAIRASLSLPEVLGTATRELGRALKSSRVHLRLYDPTNTLAPVEHEYVAAGVASIKRLSVSYDDPMGQRLLRSSKPIVIGDSLNCTIGSADFNAHVRSHSMRTGVRSQIDFPLIVSGRFRGALCIHQTDRVRHWSENEVALVEAVAAQLATGIAQAELFEMTKRAKMEWETTFNAMSDGIFIFDNQGQLIRVNRTGAAMEDSWPHLLLGRRCCDILRVSGHEGECIVEKTIKDGRSMTVEVTPERFNRPLLVTIEPVFESAGKTTGAVCTARDLSELRKVEAEARERQSLLTNVLESVRDPICAIDTSGRILWFNNASITMSGYTPEELIGHHFLELVLPADHEIARTNFESALLGQPLSYETHYQTREGEVRDALFYNSPLTIEGRTTGVLAIIRDITEHKQQQRRASQAEKLRALGQLASGVAHDFNNALAAILGRAQLMRRHVDSEALTRNLDIIQTAAEDAAATVRRIQTFARQSQDKEFQSLDVGGLLRDAVEITRTRWENEARMRGRYYDVDLDTPPMTSALGSASELREVFVNLIVNAIDAMPDGGRLKISCELAGATVRIRFTDTGTGMTEEIRERIFEPFYTTKENLGTGLGLSVSYGIIERHGGAITVASQVGQGTTFTIDLPAAEAACLEASAPQQPATESLSVLVIDDEPFVRETLAEMLQELSHKVVIAEGGRMALEKLHAGHFDLVFTDLSMPEMDGWETAGEIRRQWPDINIILVTGYGKNTVPPNGEANLVDGTIGKPFNFEQVAETIATVMGKGVGGRALGVG